MSDQKTILKQYMELNCNPTLKVISEDTGIQITRVFRLLNGSKMRLEEFKIFEEAVMKKMGMDNSLVTLAKESISKFSLMGITEMEMLFNRKLKLWRLKQVDDTDVVGEIYA